MSDTTTDFENEDSFDFTWLRDSGEEMTEGKDIQAAEHEDRKERPLKVEEVSEKKYKRRSKKKRQRVEDYVRPSLAKELYEDVKTVVIAVALAFIISTFVILNAKVPSGSMRNTIAVNDKLIGNRLAYVFSEPKRGDIVIFKYPDDESQKFIKRVIGLPGDEVVIQNHAVYVNGVKLEEDYIREEMLTAQTAVIYHVPEDCYFMLGDNRNNSKDSRFWTNTYVRKDQILAKALFRYYSGNDKSLAFKWLNQKQEYDV